MTEMISKAKKIVDIGGLYQPPDGEFLSAIATGMAKALNTGTTPLLRMMIGIYPLLPRTTAERTYAGNLVKLIVADQCKLQREAGRSCRPWIVARGDVHVQLVYMRTRNAASLAADNTWDHEKVLDVDGRDALVGGMNYWTSNYLQTASPVSDISMRVQGPAAADALAFDDTLWSWRCSHTNPFEPVIELNVRACTSHTVPSQPIPGGGAVPILTVGRLGIGIPVPGHENAESPPIPRPALNGNICRNKELTDPNLTAPNTSRTYEYANPGEDALRTLVKSATKSIFISQQDLLGCFIPGPFETIKNWLHGRDPYFDERLFEALGKKIADRIPITIVVSAGGLSGNYTTGTTPQDLAQALTKMVMAQTKSTYGQAREMVCTDVGISQEHNTDTNTWADGVAFGSHAKLVEVDGDAFYIGSENLYPARLQELGFIVENRDAADTLTSDYIKPLWRWSAPYALIDPSTGRCGSFTGQTFERQLRVIKLRNTASKNVEVQWANLGPDFSYTHTGDAKTDFSTETAADGVWRLFSLPTLPRTAPPALLGHIGLGNTGSKTVEVKWDAQVPFVGSFKRVASFNSTIPVADAADGVWQLTSSANGFPELAHINLAGTKDGKVAVQWFTVQNGVYRQAATASTDFSAADAADGVWQLLYGTRELAFIQLKNTLSGHVEVHWDLLENGVFKRAGNATSDLNARGFHVPRGTWELFPSANFSSHFAPDVALIELNGIPNGNVAVKWLTLQSGRYADAADYSSNIPTMTPGAAVWELAGAL